MQLDSSRRQIFRARNFSLSFVRDVRDLAKLSRVLERLVVDKGEVEVERAGIETETLVESRFVMSERVSEDKLDLKCEKVSVRED